jgi:ATP-binding cassette subfamily C (CFTR/MRP) protein 1
MRTTFWSSWPTLLGVTAARISLAIAMLFQPLLIQQITLWLDNKNAQSDVGYGLIGLTVILYLAMAFSNVVYKRQLDRLATKTRGILISVLHWKVLSMSPEQLADGAALALLSVDSTRICTAIPQIAELLVAPLEIIGATILLERQIGIFCLAPVLLNVLICGISSANTMKGVPHQKKWLVAVQKRIAYTASILACPKSFRMLGLTEHLRGHIQVLRVHELAECANYRKFVTIRNTFAWMPDGLVPATTLTVFAIFNGSRAITPSMAFTTLSIVTLLSTPVHQGILAIPEFLNALTSFGRIERFILEADNQRAVDDDITSSVAPSDGATYGLELSNIQVSGDTIDSAVRLEAATVCRTQSDGKILDEVSIDIPRAKFTFIVGPVGSGKSTLLRVVMGDVRLSSGHRTILPCSDEFGFCAQDAWLPNDTVKNIILGHSDFDDTWYHSIIKACDLISDIDQFSQGDNTIVGNRGSSLSGGQKQKIALARALYSRKKMLVLDDITSGLDSRSSGMIINNVKDFCNKHGVTVMLATHAVHHLRHADYIVALGNGGKVTKQGSLEALSSQDDYVQQLKLRAEDNSSEEEKEEFDLTNEPIVAHAAHDDTQNELARRTRDLSVYKYYTSSIGWTLGSLILLSATIFAFGNQFPGLWVRWWSEAEISGQRHYPLDLWVCVYFSLGIVAVTSVFCNYWIFLVWTIPQSSAKLHKQLLDGVMDAPYSFFVNTDPGVTLNRFANDMSLIEIQLAGAVVQTLFGVGICVGATMLIAAGAEYMGVFIPLILAVLYMLQKFYLRTSRQLRFLELETQAPLLGHFQETLAGVTTIRAFHWQRHSRQQCADLLDRAQRPFYLLLCLQRWLNLVLDLITAAMAVTVVTFAIALQSTASSSSVGLSLLNILGFNTHLSVLIVAWTALETSLGAVARCKNFATGTPSEHLVEEHVEPPLDWPSEGHLELSNVTAAYTKDGIAVLRDVSLSIPAGAKVGICGRSGSGKSSMLLLLFRMLEQNSGTIEVDKLDLSTIPRNTIRNRFTTLPQDALCLPGSMRTNLDPSETHDTQEITSVLSKVGLLSLLIARGGLDIEMSSLKLSRGEMQLFAVARALLRPTKLLIVDEMTSAVDESTERRMMDLIQTEFRLSTVIAVAHRLRTITNFDLLIVMDAGCVVECGSPDELLGKSEGWFKRMWDNGL